jgi:hypothetical protein
MARNHSIDIGILTILSGNTESEPLKMNQMPLRGVTVFSPAALDGLVTIEVSGDFAEAVPTWQKLQSGGSNVEVGAVQAVPLDYVGWDAFRLSSDTPETADRAFRLKGVEDLQGGFA